MEVQTAMWIPGDVGSYHVDYGDHGLPDYRGSYDRMSAREILEIWQNECHADISLPDRGWNTSSTSESIGLYTCFHSIGLKLSWYQLEYCDGRGDNMADKDSAKENENNVASLMPRSGRQGRKRDD